MDRYALSDEGRARFRRTRTGVDIMGEAKREGYEILDYLYRHGAATLEEIEKVTGLSGSRLVTRIWAFIHQGIVEKLGGK